jgi:hypothetical protein
MCVQRIQESPLPTYEYIQADVTNKTDHCILHFSRLFASCFRHQRRSTLAAECYFTVYRKLTLIKVYAFFFLIITQHFRALYAVALVQGTSHNAQDLYWYVGSEIVTAAVMNSSIFWVIPPCKGKFVPVLN